MAGKRILVVDDEPFVLDSIKLALGFAGHIVEAADSGPAALQKLKESRFDLVVTDRNMPGMSGEELAAEIKRFVPGLPVLLLTGYPPEKLPGCIDAILPKPYSVAELWEIIAKLTQ